MLRSVLATLDVLCLPDVSVSKMKSCVLSRVCHVENGKIHVRLLMMMIAFITFKSSLVPLLEGL